MSVTISGDGTITGLDADGISSQPVFPGNVLQVVSTTKTDVFSVSGASDTFVDITGFSVSITPSSTSSKILVFGNVAGGASAQTAIWYRIVRDSTPIAVSSSGTSIRVDQEAFNVTARAWHHASFSHLDAPATTSSLTYKLQIYDTSFETPTLYVNRNADSVGTSVSSITVMEIAG